MNKAARLTLPGFKIYCKATATETVWYQQKQSLPSRWDRTEGPAINPHVHCCSSVHKSYPTLCDPRDCSMPTFPVLHHLLEFAQTHVHWVNDAIQPSLSLSPPFSPTFNLAQQHGLFKWVSSMHQVAKVLELQLQRQSFQRIFRVDFL